MNFSRSSEESLDLSIMSGPSETCEICSFGFNIDHICLDVNQLNFNRLSLQDFQLFPARQMEELDYEEVIEYNDEGEQDIVEAELSIIDDLEESNGYITLNFQSPPRQLAPPRRRSSTPDPTRSRRSSITFDEFLENLMDDSMDMPGLEHDATDESVAAEAAADEAAVDEAAADEAAADEAAADEADYSEWMEF